MLMLYFLVFIEGINETVNDNCIHFIVIHEKDSFFIVVLNVHFFLHNVPIRLIVYCLDFVIVGIIVIWHKDVIFDH
jgi:hypothetical protein